LSRTTKYQEYQFTEEGGIRSWRAYDIGPGRLLQCRDLQMSAQLDTNLNVIKRIEIAEEIGELMKRETSKTSADIY